MKQNRAPALLAREDRVQCGASESGKQRQQRQLHLNCRSCSTHSPVRAGWPTPPHRPPGLPARLGRRPVLPPPPAHGATRQGPECPPPCNRTIFGAAAALLVCWLSGRRVRCWPAVFLPTGRAPRTSPLCLNRRSCGACYAMDDAMGEQWRKRWNASGARRARQVDPLAARRAVGCPSSPVVSLFGLHIKSVSFLSSAKPRPLSHSGR